MTTLQAFSVPGEPHATQRPRVTKNGTFTPRASRDAQALVGQIYVALFGREETADSEHAYRVHVTSYRYERRPRDGDNLVKTVLDGLNGLAFADDSQVEVHSHSTVWVDSRAAARTWVEVERLATPARPPRRKA